jgi:hypothetical protein
MPQLQHFVVPQFIDIESKILGPITTRQFLWVLGAGLIFFIALRTLPVGAFIIFSILDVVVFGSFAFIKVNGQLFHNFLLSAVSFSRKPRLYLWSAGIAAASRSVEPVAEVAAPARGAVPSRRLSELALLVDTGGTYQPVTSFKDVPPMPENHGSQA